MPTDRTRERPDFGEILNQGGKVFVGELNPNKTSLVKYIYRNEKGSQICSAFRANGTTICTSTAVMGNGRCSRHGGKAIAGPAHYKFRTGRYSRQMPTRLLERYQEGLADETLTDFNDDLAVIDARLDDLFSQMDEGGGKEIFAEIKDAYKSFKYANQDGDPQAMREALRRLDDAISRGSGESFLWTEVRNLQEQRRKIILAQAKHMQLTNQTVAVAKVNLLVSALLDSVRGRVNDPNVLNEINSDFLRIMNAGSKQLKA